MPNCFTLSCLGPDLSECYNLRDRPPRTLTGRHGGQKITHQRRHIMKARLTKTGIGYFEHRLSMIINDFHKLFCQEFPEKEMSREQKVKEIITGKARVPESVFLNAGSGCPSGRLFDHFEYSDKGAFKEYNTALEEIKGMSLEEMREAKKGFIDQYVYGLKEGNDIIEAFTEICRKIYGKHSKKINVKPVKGKRSSGTN